MGVVILAMPIILSQMCVFITNERIVLVQFFLTSQSPRLLDRNLSILSQFVQVLSKFCPLKIIDKSTLFDTKIGCGQKLRNLVDFFIMFLLPDFHFFVHLSKNRKKPLINQYF